MSSVEEPLGHDANRAMLRELARASASGAAPLQHAWLFAGPAGVGKFAVARWWAALLKCPQLGNCSPACESCRLVAGAVHPDVLEVRPPPKEKDAVQAADDTLERKKNVGVAESRSVIARLALRPTRPGPRVAIVREAASMTIEAQNALLKLLEEPPGSAVVILVADNIGAMLTTVRSRCRHLRFGTLSDDEVAAVLARQGWAQDAARRGAACSGGSVERALQYDADGLADREQLLLAYERLRDDASGLDALVQAFVAHKEQGYALPELLEWQMSKVAVSLGRSREEASPALARILERSLARDPAEPRSAGPARLLDEAQRIRRSIDALARNANAKLVIRDLLMNVRASGR